MVFAQWAKNNSKINDGKDFDEAFLQAIYDRIAKSPLKLNDNGPAATEEAGASKSAPFTSCYKQGVVKHMMQSTWQYLVDVFDFLMTNCDVCAKS